VTTPEVHPNPVYEKGLFSKKLFELGVWNDFARQVMDGLDDEFTLRDLERKVGYFKEKVRHDLELAGNVADAIVNLANSNYTVSYSQADDISQRIIFPTSPAERNGIEDARFVQFFEDDGSCTYYATYSAYDGRVVIPQMLETKDFLDFTISTLNGPQAQNKGMALFPRKINGNYAMISRQDNENIYIMFSDMPHFWYERKVLIKPTYPWEFVQLGNCGSPVETDAGWLVITHGVGPMRKYSIGAFLLDLEDPGKVIGRLNEPLLSANENEREGYVPNVVYSCGAQVHNGRLVIPYAMSDYASSFASVDLKKLLRELTRA
jgi:predicted GH43/DUF377 family glycosyl hydrolase